MRSMCCRLRFLAQSRSIASIALTQDRMWNALRHQFPIQGRPRKSSIVIIVKDLGFSLVQNGLRDSLTAGGICPLPTSPSVMLSPVTRPGKYLTVADCIRKSPPPAASSGDLKYRFGGKEKRISLGVYPDVSLKEARRRRAQARQLLAREIDPSEHRKAQKAASDSSRILRRLERHVFPWMGDRPLAVITAPELLRVVRRIQQWGALDIAHRALQTCGQVFRYAVATGRVRRDPTGDLRGHCHRSREPASPP